MRMRFRSVVGVCVYFCVVCVVYIVLQDILSVRFFRVFSWMGFERREVFWDGVFIVGFRFLDFRVYLLLSLVRRGWIGSLENKVFISLLCKVFFQRVFISFWIYQFGLGVCRVWGIYRFWVLWFSQVFFFYKRILIIIFYNCVRFSFDGGFFRFFY